jgi:hypothetical protein
VPGKADIEASCIARMSLKPGGTLIVHDFMVDNDLTGPASAALDAVLTRRSPCASLSGMSRLMKMRVSRLSPAISCRRSESWWA